MISTRKIQRKKRENERGAIFDGTRGSFVFLPLKEFEEIKSKKEIDDDFENSVGYRSNGISKSYSPMDLVDLLSTKSDAELACITSDEKYEMETKLLNLMVRLRNLK